MGKQILSRPPTSCVGSKDSISSAVKRKKPKTRKPKVTETNSCGKSKGCEQPQNEPEATALTLTATTPRERHVFNPTNHLPFPPEIRNRIYKLLLSIPSSIVPSSRLLYSPALGTPRCFDLSILLVSKQTYLESFHILYANNTLAFDDTDELLVFLQRIGYARRQQMTSVVFRWRGTEPKAAFRLLRTCTRVKSIRLSLNHFRQKGYMALREVRGMEYVGMYHEAGSACSCTSEHWQCHICMHGNPKLLSDPEELKAAMMRPRLKHYELMEDEEIDLFKTKRERFWKGEVHWLGWK